MIKLKNEPTYEYNNQQRIVRVVEITGTAKVIGKRGAYTLVRLVENDNYYLVK